MNLQINFLSKKICLCCGSPLLSNSKISLVHLGEMHPKIISCSMSFYSFLYVAQWPSPSSQTSLCSSALQSSSRQNYKVIQFAKDLWRATVQPPGAKQSYCPSQHSHRNQRTRSSAAMNRKIIGIHQFTVVHGFTLQKQQSKRCCWVFVLNCYQKLKC